MNAPGSLALLGFCSATVLLGQASRKCGLVVTPHIVGHNSMRLKVAHQITVPTKLKCLRIEVAIPTSSADLLRPLSGGVLSSILPCGAEYYALFRCWFDL